MVFTTLNTYTSPHHRRNLEALRLRHCLRARRNIHGAEMWQVMWNFGIAIISLGASSIPTSDAAGHAT